MAVILPEEMVRDVLERLPVKSLMRFKSVHRTWNDLFKTHSFVSRHGQRQRQRSYEHLMIFESFVTLIPHITLLFCNKPPHFEIQDLQHLFSSPDNSNFVVHISSHGHHNGVFCIEGFFQNNGGIFQMILWNPATREVKVIPPPLKKPSSNKTITYTGFGADPNTLNDFKVIKLYLMFNNEIGIPTPLAQVYNLSANSWTVICNAYDSGIIDLFTTTTGRCPFYDTTLASHWLSWDYAYILYFDFNDNKFRKLNTPPIATVHNGSLVEANDGSIAYIAYKGLTDSCLIEIWILKNDKWTQNYNIEPLNMGVRVYAVWKDGAEFLGGSPSHSLVLYNSDAQLLHQFQIYPHCYFFIHKYVESLAPLSTNLAS